MTTLVDVWNGRDELPIEIDLPNQMRFHSVFACPILRQQVWISLVFFYHKGVIGYKISDHGKKTKYRVSLYFHSSISPISSPCKGL